MVERRASLQHAADPASLDGLGATETRLEGRLYRSALPMVIGS